jgi:hypothetical protein
MHHEMNTNLDGFLQNWMGYGNLINPFFVIGPEPGGTAEELPARVTAWHSLTQMLPPEERHLVDALLFHNKIKERRWFSERPQLQPTWRRVIIAYLTARNKRIDVDIIRNVQRDLFGNATTRGITKMYLLPLSSPTQRIWQYSALYKDREDCERVCGAQRIKWFQDLMKASHRKKVLMLGFSNTSHYYQIPELGPDVSWQTTYVCEKKIETVRDVNANQYVIAYHPMASYSTDDYFRQIGRLMSFD